jgi:hypothetical protein
MLWLAGAAVAILLHADEQQQAVGGSADGARLAFRNFV